MASSIETRVQKIEEVANSKDGFLVVFRKEGQTDDDAWSEAFGDKRRPARNVVFLNERDKAL